MGGIGVLLQADSDLVSPWMEYEILHFNRLIGDRILLVGGPHLKEKNLDLQCPIELSVKINMLSLF